LTAISETRVNIEVEEAPKAITAKIIPKILKEIHAETTKVFLKKKIIPKTFSSVAPRDTGSVID
jgi:hypothetical protein